jgi:hypothetical protein
MAWSARWTRFRHWAWRDRVARDQPDELAAARASRETVAALVEDAVR